LNRMINSPASGLGGGRTARWLPACILLAALFFAVGTKSLDASSWDLGGRPVPGPLPPNPIAARPDLAVKLDVVYGIAAGVELKMDLAKPSLCASQRVPVVLYVHGGGWTAGDKSGFLDTGVANMLYQLGFAVGSINYRLAPEHNFPAQINDCKLAVRFLRANADALGINPGRIGVMGGSAGGHLVLLMGLAGPGDGLEGPGLEAYSSSVLAVVNYYGPTDLTLPGLSFHPLILALLGCSPTECPDLVRAASPVAHVTPGDTPIMTIHGENDSVVPYNQAVAVSIELRKVANACSLIKVKNAEHGFVPDPITAQIQPTLNEINWLTVAHLARYIEPALLGDMNMDGKINWADLYELVSRLSMQGVGPDGLEAPDSWNPLADLFPDGIVDAQDFSVFFAICTGQYTHAQRASGQN